MVTGCYAQLESEAVSRIEGVDAWFQREAPAATVLERCLTEKESVEGAEAVDALHEYHSVTRAR